MVHKCATSAGSRPPSSYGQCECRCAHRLAEPTISSTAATSTGTSEDSTSRPPAAPSTAGRRGQPLNEMEPPGEHALLAAQVCQAWGTPFRGTSSGKEAPAARAASAAQAQHAPPAAPALCLPPHTSHPTPQVRRQGSRAYASQRAGDGTSRGVLGRDPTRPPVTATSSSMRTPMPAKRPKAGSSGM